MSKQKSKMTQQEKMVQGTAWLTFGNFLSRLLGAIYIIPWYAWMAPHAAEANALFGMGYEIYALFLLVSTVGIPVAVAKQVAKYNTLDKPEMSFYLIRKVFMFMLLLGSFFAVIMFFGSPVLAGLSGGGKDLIPVMQSLTLAVLVFPAMSVLRGFFQGFNNLKPYAISQIAEQVIRVIWMLLTAFYIMKMGSGDYVAAVTQSTFAAFIGMFASLSVLVYFLWKENMLHQVFLKAPKSIDLDTKSILMETIKEAIPFVITGSAIQVFRLIDQMTFINSMGWFTDYSNRELRIMFAYFSSNPGKLTMILIAVATAIAGTGIPLLTENIVKNDKKAAAKLVINNTQMLFLFLLPAIFGSVVLAVPLYTVFYGVPDVLALHLFIVSLLQTIFLGLYTVSSPMLQALFENRKAVLYFLYGVIAKLILQIPFIFVFHSYGPLLSTMIALIIPIVFIYKRIHEITNFNRSLLVKSSTLMIIMTIVMIVAVIVVNSILGLIALPQNRLLSVVYLILVGGVGIVVYGGLSLWSGALDLLLGTKAVALRKKLGWEK
ncbi:putative polysaccharide biosynthesis protein [Streptococcus zalophi]|uniref:Polysaccharide biosynthesis protein n=1 Tax=Streptococcus zalophi TaxID=640031 RepID=A0A934P8K9_9STRE|nr:polysaccharide biosynthesis protein [Streptococcus zalophi]MBJ8349149.1 polysaccharide biosynthesis protein [Streptococcus zalophi]MCR8967699.1 polysaccharide biosynthesis protein [Streptococcus zalophi]